jgi:hypothetical protein
VFAEFLLFASTSFLSLYHDKYTYSLPPYTVRTSPCREYRNNRNPAMILSTSRLRPTHPFVNLGASRNLEDAMDDTRMMRMKLLE